MGFQSDNDVNRETTHRAKWENDFKIWVIGTHYCHSRQFKVNENTYKMLFKMYVAKTERSYKNMNNLFDYVEKKMQKLRKIGLKSNLTKLKNLQIMLVLF